MNRRQTPRAPTRTLAQFNASRERESMISTALASTPLDDEVLQRVVWTYVSEERRAGTTAGRVILTLTELIQKSFATPNAEHHALERRVILWCVGAYYDDVAAVIADDSGIAARGGSSRTATLSGRISKSADR